MVRCGCGGRFESVVLTSFDFSAFAGLPVLLKETPGLRCNKCRAETLEGTIINAALESIVIAILEIPSMLDGFRVKFLRKHLGMTRYQFADQLLLDRWELVDEWENHCSPIDEIHAQAISALVRKINSVRRSNGSVAVKIQL